MRIATWFPLTAVWRFFAPPVVAGRTLPRPKRSHRGPRGRRLGFRPGAGCYEQLERREALNATYHGGALIPHVEVQAIYLGSNWETQATLKSESAQLDAFLDYLVDSPYMDMLTDAGYGVGQGTATPGFVANVSLASFNQIFDSDIRGVIDQAIDLSKVQQPTANSLYVVYVEAGKNVNFNGVTSQSGNLKGYHSAFAGADREGVPFDIHYVVVPHPGAPNPTSVTNGYTGIPEVQSLTIGGTSTGTLVPKFNNVSATTTLTWTNGAAPTAAQVQTSLSSIPALAGNVTVTASAGGAFNISVRNLGNIDPIDVSATTGGLTASIATLADGINGVTSDFDQLTSVTSRFLVNAVTNPNHNFKTRGWFDDATNREIADVAVTPANIADVHSRLGPNQYLVQHVFAQDGTIISPDTTAVDLTTNPTVISVISLSLTRAQITWTAVVGATGYRVFLVSGGKSTLLARVPASQTSTVLTNLTPGAKLELRVEAYNAADVTSATTTFDVPNPGLVGPQNFKATAASASSVVLTWDANKTAAGYRIFMTQGTRTIILASLGERGELGQTQITHTITGLKPGSKLSFRVVAFRGSQVLSSVTKTVTLPQIVLTAPEVTAIAVNGDRRVVRLEWNTVAGAQGYRIYRLQGTQRVLLTSLKATATSHTIRGLPAGTRFVVQAFRGTQTKNSLSKSV